MTRGVVKWFSHDSCRPAWKAWLNARSPSVLRCPLSIIPYPLSISVLRFPLSGTCFPLSFVRYPLSIIGCPLSVGHDPLSITRYPLFFILCPLSVTRCPFSAIRCLLFDVRCPLSVANMAQIFMCLFTVTKGSTTQTRLVCCRSFHGAQSPTNSPERFPLDRSCLPVAWLPPTRCAPLRSNSQVPAGRHGRRRVGCCLVLQGASAAPPGSPSAGECLRRSGGGERRRDPRPGVGGRGGIGVALGSRSREGRGFRRHGYRGS